jgi:imidazolonepropionase-like amidohydrolase
MGTLSTSPDMLGSNAALAGARTTYDVGAVLNAGFTSVRELAGWGGHISSAINDGSILGPNIYSSISILSMTAGHGDVHGVPLTALLDASAHGLPFALCDGVPECIRAVRLQLRQGAKVIKLCASGGVGSELDNVEDRQFSDAELEAIVQEAGRAKRIVAAHCHGKEGIMAALRAGCMTIEHGSYLDEEAAALMKEKGAIFVTTRSIIEGGLKLKQIWTPMQYEKLKAISAKSKAACALAIKSGVKVALGTDLCLSDRDTVLSHGKNGKELTYAVGLGMTPLEAIEACTATAPETLGPQAPKSGWLKQGYDADLIAVSENPLDDVGVLADPANITHVWKGGKLLKSP